MTLMESGLVFEVRVFVLCAFSGVLCAFLYDMFKIVRRTLRVGAGLTFLLDFSFWICAALVMFGMLLFANHGQIRLFEGIAILLGAVVYFLSVSQVVVLCGTMLLSKVLKWMYCIVKIVLFPVWILNRYVFHPICQKIAKKIKKIRKKRLTIRLFWFRINKGMVFLKKYRQNK